MKKTLTTLLLCLLAPVVLILMLKDLILSLLASGSDKLLDKAEELEDKAVEKLRSLSKPTEETKNKIDELKTSIETRTKESVGSDWHLNRKD